MFCFNEFQVISSSALRLRYLIFRTKSFSLEIFFLKIFFTLNFSFKEFFSLIFWGKFAFIFCQEISQMMKKIWKFDQEKMEENSQKLVNLFSPTNFLGRLAYSTEKSKMNALWSPGKIKKLCPRGFWTLMKKKCINYFQLCDERNVELLSQRSINKIKKVFSHFWIWWELGRIRRFL